MPPLGFSALSQRALSEVASASLAQLSDVIYFVGLEVNSGSYTDISADVFRFNINRRLATLRDPIGDGSFMAELDNTGAKFSPANAASVYSPNLVPGRRVFVRATYAGSMHNLFKGETTEIKILSGIAQRKVILSAVDGVQKLRQTQITTSLFIDSNPGSLFAVVMAQCNVASYAADTFADEIPYAWFRDISADEALRRLIEFGDYSASVDPAGTVTLRNRQAGWRAGVVASYSAVGTNGFYALDYALTADSIVNRAVVGGNARKASTSQQTVAWVTDAPTIAASSHLGFWVAYVDPVDPTVLTPATSLQSPVSSSDWTMNTSAGGGGTDRTATGSLNITLFGEAAVCSLFNGSANTVYLTKFQIRGYSIQQQPRISVQYDVTSSQDVYGKHELSLDSDFISLQSYAKDYAKVISDNRHTPLPNVSATLRNRFPDVFMRDLGDLVSIVESHSAVNSQWAVFEITHDVSFAAGLDHTTKLDVRFYSNRPLLVLDDAVRGVLDGTRELAF